MRSIVLIALLVFAIYVYQKKTPKKQKGGNVLGWLIGGLLVVVINVIIVIVVVGIVELSEEEVPGPGTRGAGGTGGGAGTGGATEPGQTGVNDDDVNDEASCWRNYPTLSKNEAIKRYSGDIPFPEKYQNTKCIGDDKLFLGPGGKPLKLNTCTNNVMQGGKDYAWCQTQNTDPDDTVAKWAFCKPRSELSTEEKKTFNCANQPTSWLNKEVTE